MNTKQNGPSWSELFVCAVTCATLAGAFAFDQGMRAHRKNMSLELANELYFQMQGKYRDGWKFAFDTFSRTNTHIGPLVLGPGSHVVSNCVFISESYGIQVECTNGPVQIYGGHYYVGFTEGSFEDVWERATSPNPVPKWP